MSFLLAFSALSLLASSSVSRRIGDETAPAPATVAANDNRRAAGTRQNGVLSLQLEARTGTWFPEGPSGRGLEVAAWAERGKPLQTPGPLIRVPLGTVVRAQLCNTLGRPLTVFGFSGTRGRADSLVLPAGATREVQFTATSAGTFYYMARSAPDPFGFRQGEDSQLHGAIVVDPPDARLQSDDRVFVMSWWFTLDDSSKTGIGRATMAINGLAWPHTERIDLTQGDSASWRVINHTESDHPMHLHGFYFRTESKGDGIRDTLYAPNEQRQAVTELLFPMQTMTLSWLPDRPGHWIYHCHFAGHLSHNASLDTHRGEQEVHQGHRDTSRVPNSPHQMYGLVLGIRVAPRGPQVATSASARAMRLTIRERAGVYGDKPGYAFVLDGTREASRPDALPLPGSTLVLRKGERVAVTIVNRSHDRASVHWHGIELESFADGVPGWSGGEQEILPSIAPNDSITVRFTPPRAGTFMYHSHYNEDHQINSGLYGAIIVLDNGERLDPELDRALLFSSAGPTTNVIRGPWTPTLLNGQAKPAPIELEMGRRYRFRLINITSDVNTTVAINDGDAPVRWRLVAKDGATVPVSQATLRPARLFFDPGEIYDFEFTPELPGSLTLIFGPPDAPPEFGMPARVSVPVNVR